MALMQEDLHQIIKRYIQSDDFEFVSFENSNLSQQSVGFLSDQGKKCIKFKSKGTPHEIYVFIKELPDSEYHRSLVTEIGTFQRESLVYDKILANFHEYSMPVPKCYLANEETVVLEDLSLKGFTNTNLYETLDIDHCKKVLDSLAKLHAASFIIERRNNIKINEKYPIIETEVLMNENRKHPGNKSAMAGVKGMRQLARKYLPYYTNDVVNKAIHYMENVFSKLKSSEICPKVLSHNDLWINNIMFRYDQTGKLEEAFLIDFQLTNYKPPSYDVQFFLHTCTSKEFRDLHYIYLAEYYYNALSQQLALAKINIDGIIPRETFERMQKETLPVVLGLTPIYISFILMPHQILKNVSETDGKLKSYFEEDRTKYMLQAMIENEHYKQRLLSCLKELFDYFK